MRDGLHLGSIKTFFSITAPYDIETNVLDDNSDACMPSSSSAFKAFLISSDFFLGAGASCLNVCKILFILLTMCTKFNPFTSMMLYYYYSSQEASIDTSWILCFSSLCSVSVLPSAAGWCSESISTVWCYT